MNAPRTNGPPRRGIMLLEMVVAGLVLGAAMVLVVQVLARTLAVREATNRRSLATREAANLMERYAGRVRDGRADGQAGPVDLSAEARRGLPGGEARVEVVDPTANAPGLARIAVEVRWRDVSGGFESPARLVAFVAPAGAGGGR